MKIYVRDDAFMTRRIMKGFTQRELAKRTGLSYTYISLIERSLKSVGPASAKKLSEVLETPFHDLFTLRARG